MSSPTTKRLIPSKALPWLFSLTAFAGASLLFIVEPLAAKLLLPAFGGAASVWATSTLFFQTVLLLAYILVHYTAKLGPKKQSFVHLPLLVAALVVLPIALPDEVAEAGQNPVLAVVRAMVVLLGLPFIVLSTTGPLIQKWYSWSDGPRSDDPYFIYAASNVGSFVGLLSYPFLIEPYVSLDGQRMIWSVAFGTFILLLVACGATVFNSKPAKEERAIAAEKLPLKRYGKWIALAFLPSSLMLGVTTYLTTDVASIPLLWVIPLAIYLATMIAAFGRKGRTPVKGLLEFATLLSIVAVAMGLQGNLVSLWMAGATSFIALAVVSYAAHSYLAIDRPETAHLTKYFVAISFGGALGGLFNGFIAPTVFDRPVEFFLVFSLVPLMLLQKVGVKKWAVFSIAAVTFAGFVAQNAMHNTGELQRSRTFYGSYRIVEDSKTVSFFHGTTSHGMQYKSPEARNEPVAYYAKEGPLGEVFKQYDPKAKNVTVVGLGAGTMAAYSKPGQKWTFIEIDPEVIKLAEDTRYFDYLEKAPAEIDLIAADGRRAISELPDGSQDLIVLDAFSSDSIPVHLLTQEAIAEYKEKLAPNGAIVVHISNRVFDLAPVVVSSALHADLRAVGSNDTKFGKYSFPSTWMILTEDEDWAKEIDKLENWGDITDSVKPVKWTDDYSSVLKVLY